MSGQDKRDEYIKQLEEEVKGLQVEKARLKEELQAYKNKEKTTYPIFEPFFKKKERSRQDD